MAKRRRKKSSPSVQALRRQIQGLKKRLPRLSLMPRLPHSSGFIAGVGIGLAAGGGGGLPLAGVTGRHQATPKATRVAAVAAPKPVHPAPAVQPMPSVAPPPAYVEQTEPGQDEAAD